MNTLQKRMAAALLDGEHPALAALRDQWAAASVKWDSIEDSIYSAHLKIPSTCKPLFTEGRADIRDVHAKISGLATAAELELIIVDGRLRVLRGSTLNDEPWPKNAEIERCYFIDRVGNETAVRDVEVALQQVLERQSDPDRLYLDDLLEFVGDDEFDELVDRLVPSHEEADTVQGEILRSVLRISAEFEREGCGNWRESPEFYGGFVQFLLEHLCDGTFDEEVETFTRELLLLVQRFGESETDDSSSESERVLTRDLNHLEPIAAAWCLRHPDLIPHKVD